MNILKQKQGKPLVKMQGATLVEVLVSVLIFSCGMLAIAGLQAESFKSTGGVQYRAEAIHLVSAYVGKIKAVAPPAADGGMATAAAQAPFVPGGTEFVFFENELTGKLPGASTPTVDFTPDSCAVTLPVGSSCVDITVTWNPAGEKYAGGDTAHRYTQTSVIGSN
ncbi:MAG: hypothetical protein LBE32_05155 [Burkholderiales bacterium]|nr:hypothetical protein [Burkholderiales bacterium]